MRCTLHHLVRLSRRALWIELHAVRFGVRLFVLLTSELQILIVKFH